MRTSFLYLLGRLRKTPQRLAAWRNLSPYDSGPEIIWDNDCISPTSTFNQGNLKYMTYVIHVAKWYFVMKDCILSSI